MRSQDHLKVKETPVKGGTTAKVMDTMAYHLVPDASVTLRTPTSGTRIDITLLSGDVNEATLIKWLQLEYQATILSTTQIPAILAIYKATSVRDINDEDIVQDLKLNKSLFLHRAVVFPIESVGTLMLKKMLRRVILSPGPENLYLSVLPKRTGAANTYQEYKVLKYASQLTG